MFILVVLILLVPALISVLLYERFKGYALDWCKRVELLLILAFMINLAGYAVLWLRGWDQLSFLLNDNSSMILIPVVVQYMAITLVSAVVIAYVLSLVRVEKSARNKTAPETGEASDASDAIADTDAGTGTDAGTVKMSQDTSAS